MAKYNLNLNWNIKMKFLDANVTSAMSFQIRKLDIASYFEIGITLLDSLNFYNLLNRYGPKI